MRAEVKRILDEGIELKLNTKVGEEISLDEIKKQGYEAVFIATGLQIGRTLKIEGSKLPGVLNGLGFLHHVNVGEPVEIGREVLVIRGGNVAIDVAITASRTGARKVKLVCLEYRSSMPAHEWEIEDALQEGVESINSRGPVKINGKERVEGLLVRRCVSVVDESGRFNPKFDDSVEEEIPADTVIFAIGQAIDRKVVENLGLELSDSGTIKVDDTTLETSTKGVFAGGDAIKIRSSVVEAVGFGDEAAISIDRFIHEKDLHAGREKDRETAQKTEKIVETIPRAKERRTPPEERRDNFTEMLKTLSAEEAVNEARRCLNCGICSECFQCYYACEPKCIAWIQCVGSRDKLCGNEYCSSVCCMYATKQAIVTKEHSGEHTETFIFCNDIRAFGKGFEQYYDRAKNELGVRYIKCIVSSVKQLNQSKDLIVKYIDNENRIAEEIFDLVVLSVGMVPSHSSADLFKRLGLKTNRYGFCASAPLLPLETNRKGVFICGAGGAPKDIPESVTQASSAAALAGELLSEARGARVTEKSCPPELSTDSEQPGIGVFVCHCGTNIARVIDVEELTNFASRLPRVVHTERNLYTCSTDTQRAIVETIKEKGINHVVVSSCTPRTHESLFQDMIREAGLNKYLFEMANIRDQCSWVHADTPDLALEKAKDLLAMAVERTSTLEPLKEKEYEINRSTLVIGGGASGITAALSLAEQGFHAYLLEKSDQFGGNLRKVKYLLDGTDTSPFLENLIQKVENHPLIEIFKNSEVLDFSGHVGDFKTLIRTGGEERLIEHGTVIFATGAEEYLPEEYLYGSSRHVTTQLELEQLHVENPHVVKELKSVVMIQCVGSGEEPFNYCSRLCCQEPIKNSLKIKELNPDVNIYVLYRDIRTYGFNELFYLQAREKGVTFIRYDVEKKPEVKEAGNRLTVSVFDITLGDTVELPADRLILSAGIRIDENRKKLLQKLKVPGNEDGFLLEARIKLRPLDFANEGMFMAGLAHSPKLLMESLVQARGAASRSATILSRDRLKISGTVAVVDEERRAVCFTCVRVCPYGGPRINENNSTFIDPASCQGCGTCAASCPAKAIDVLYYKDRQILAKCEAI